MGSIILMGVLADQYVLAMLLAVRVFHDAQLKSKRSFERLSDDKDTNRGADLTEPRALTHCPGCYDSWLQKHTQEALN